MTVVFRCRASSQVGMGHLVRCRVLAKSLKARGVQSVMTGPALAFRVDTDADLFTDWIAREAWGSAAEEAGFIADIARSYGGTCIVMDDYRSDGLHQSILREDGFRVLQQYDASKPQNFAAQLVINSSPAERRKFYEAGLIANPVTMLHGPRYAILRASFKAVEPKVFSEKCQRILVSFGGGDDRGAILNILDMLKVDNLPHVSFELMVGPSNPNIKIIELWIDNNPDMAVNLHVNPNDVPKLMLSCDMAILSGGTSTFEAAYCGLPMILLPIVPNQYAQGEGWDALGAAICLGPIETLTGNNLRNTLRRLIEDSKQRNHMYKMGRNAVDGYGVERILDALLKDYNDD